MRNQITRRRALRAIGGLGMGALAASCGSQTSTQPTAAPGATTAPAATSAPEATTAPAATTAPSQAPVTLRWNVSDATEVPVMLEMGKAAADAMAQKFPNLKIVPEPPPEDNAQILTQMIAGNAPDVIGQCCDRLPLWASRGQLIKLDDYIARDVTAAQIADYPKAHWDAFANPTFGRFAMPMYMGSIAMYYDKGAFEKKGLALPDDTWSWELDGSGKYDQAMKALTNKDNREWGIVLPTGIDRLQNKLIGNGANWVDPNDNTKAVFDSPEALAVFQREFDRTWTDGYGIADAAREGMGWYALMEAGRIHMFENGDWALTAMVETVKSTTWDVALIPKGPKARNTLATTDGWVIYTKTQAPDMAWELLKYLQTDEWNNLMMSKGFIHPSRISLFDKWVDIVKKSKPELADKNLGVFRQNIEIATPLQLFKNNPDATQIINEAIDATLKTGESKDVKTAFTEAAKKVNEAQARAGSLASAVDCGCSP